MAETELFTVRFGSVHKKRQSGQLSRLYRKIHNKIQQLWIVVKSISDWNLNHNGNALKDYLVFEAS